MQYRVISNDQLGESIIARTVTLKSTEAEDVFLRATYDVATKYALRLEFYVSGAAEAVYEDRAATQTESDQISAALLAYQVNKIKSLIA